MVDDIYHLQAMIEEAEAKLDKIIELAETTPYYVINLSIDGLRHNLASRIIAEFGDISKFKTRDAMVAYVGNDPNRAESGDIEGYHLSISKKGNKRLWRILYLAVTCSIRSKKENPINAFYQKKRHKVACITKLIRTIHGMCKNGTVFTS
ncbi:transposase [Holdemania massiliensis]|mgnify:CR=1 FL=1|uniref:transposase n=1 Tax=Holdemania massiliensis TaxID=1468449 RepID=UPI00356B06CB